MGGYKKPYPGMWLLYSNNSLKSSIVKYSIGKSEIEKDDFSDFTIGDSDFHTIIVHDVR